jgi:putative transposase
MPRKCRIVACGVAHHIVQRGTDRQTVFYTDRDRLVYLQMLAAQAPLSHLRILAFCLMTNHVHLVAVPEEADSLWRCLQRVHGRYAQYLNTRRGRSGHLWQNRFYSCPLDKGHLWIALGYVERNPVRAGLVTHAEQHRWSSARAHLTGHDEFSLVDLDFWHEAGGADRWRQLLDCPEEEAQRRQLRRATFSGNPLGNAEFIAQWKRKPELRLQMQCA